MNRRHRFSYAWIFLALSFVALSLGALARNSFSVFYVEILDEFGWSRASTAGIFSVNVIAFAMAAPLAGFLVDRFGPRKVLLVGGTTLTLAMVLCSRVDTVYHLYVLFGIVGGIGASLTGYPATAPVLAQWFVRKRGLAYGILSSGWGASLLMLPLVQYSVTMFGWRISFVLVGVTVGAILLPLVALFAYHRSQDTGLFSNDIHPAAKTEPCVDEVRSTVRGNRGWESTTWSLRKAAKTYQFWLLFLTSLCIAGLVQNLVLVHQIALIRDAGFNRSFAVSVVALYGGMRVLGNLSSTISDRIGREKTLTLGCFLSIIGLFLLMSIERRSHNLIPYLYAVFFGLGMGMSTPVLGASTADFFQSRRFGPISGFMVLGFGLGGITGPWLGGFIFDVTGTYSGAITTAIVAISVACGLLWIAAPRKAKKLRREDSIL